MKISIREALFTGEEVDDWEAPKGSSWILVGRDGVWLEEAKQLGLEIRGDRVYVPNSIHTDGGAVRYSSVNHWGINENWDFYYRPDIELLFIYPDYNRSTQNVEAVLDYLSDKSLQEIKDLSGKSFPKELLR